MFSLHRNCIVLVVQNVLFVISARSECETLAALQLRRSDVIGSVDVGTLDAMDKADMVRRRLAKYAKKLDESAFNNQVLQLAGFQLYFSTGVTICEEILNVCLPYVTFVMSPVTDVGHIQAKKGIWGHLAQLFYSVVHEIHTLQIATS